MILSKAIEGFILYKSSEGLSPNTARIYRAALGKLVTFLNDQAVETITNEDLRRWFVWLRNDYLTPEAATRQPRHLSIASVQQCWRALKSFYAWANAELGLPRVDAIKCPEGESPAIVPFTQDEVRAILKAAEYTTTKATDNRRAYSQRRPTGYRNVALILLLLDTGLRVGEVARLTVSDVDIVSGAVTVAPFGSGRKTKARMVYLGKSARRALWRYTARREDGDDGDAPLFATEDGNPVKRDHLIRLVRSIGKRAGVKGCHAHRFRHTFAIEYLRGSGDVFTLKRLLGHSTLEMVNRYLALAGADDAEAHRRASPVDRWRL